MAKKFPIRERLGLTYRAEFFNFTNTPAFGLPDQVFTDQTFGRITSAGTPRQTQFALKFLF